MKNTTNLLLIAVFVFFGTACNKQEEPFVIPGTPNPNCISCPWEIIGAKINGEQWYAECNTEELGPLDNCRHTRCEYHPDDALTKWIVVRGTNEYQSRSINMLYQFINNINPHMSDAFSIGFAVYIDNDKYSDNKESKFYMDTTQARFLSIDSLDRENKLVIGSFEFTAYNILDDTAHITDGYFKMTYYP